MARLRRTRLNRLLSRFCADRTGAAAVEFAFVAFPFFLMLFTIIQTSLVLFGSVALQDLAKDAGRSIRVGQMKGKTLDQFRTAICDGGGMAAMFDCDKLMIQVQAFSDFGAASGGEVINPDCLITPPPNPNACMNAGVGRNVVIVRVSYDWPFAIDPNDLDHKTRLTAVAAFRNEPF